MTENDKKESATGFAALLSNYESVYNTGMTKREYFAAIAMQGILASGSNRPFEIIAIQSIEMADAILDKL